MNTIGPDSPPAFTARLSDPSLAACRLYVDGDWRAARSGHAFEVHNPADGRWLGHVASADPQDVEDAITAAQVAWPQWRALTPDERGSILREWAQCMRRAREDLAVIMTLEQGKPLAESRAEIDYGASFLDWFAEEGRRNCGQTIPSHLRGKRLLTSRQPVGVSAAITPWNFPSAMITRKAGAALAAGCPMIVRPADETPFSALALAVLAQRAGVPRGVFSVVTGDAAAIAAVLTSSERVRALSFTGSTEVGRLLLRHCADTIKRVSLELGGLAPFIVFGDTDPDWAAQLAVTAKFQTTGQDCLAANRIFVQRELYASFVERFVHHTAALRTGDGFECGVQLGPLISERAMTRCEEQIRDALAGGARLDLGGRRHCAGPLFLEPTVLSNVSDRMLLSTQETFGPVAGISPFDSEAEVVGRANATRYGLAAYVITHDLARALRLGEALECGMVAVNTVKFTGAPVPFGGIKQSGLGREGSSHGLDEYCDIKYLCVDVEAR